MLSAILKIIFATCSLIDARVTTLDGQVVTGLLASIDADRALITSSEGESTSLPIAAVMSISIVSQSGGATADFSKQLEVALADGSVIRANEIAASAESVTGMSEVLNEVRIPRANVRAVRLQALKPEWRAEWSAFMQRDNDRDVLVVLKRDGSGLDFLSGVVSSVGADDVPFLLDGDEIPVPRDRVFGVVFSKVDIKARSSVGEVFIKLSDGSAFKSSGVEVVSEQLKSLASWGQAVVMPIEKVTAIDFSRGRVHFLSDLEPISERYFGLDPADKSWGDLFAQDLATRTGLSSQWRMSRDRFPNSGRPPLSLRSRAYDKGLCIFPKAAIEYALDGTYSRLTAIVGVDDEVAFNQRKGQPPTAVELRIEADGQEIFKRIVKAPEDPFSLDLNVKGVTTMKVIVDFGDGNSTCDYLDLVDAKLLVDATKE